MSYSISRMDEGIFDWQYVCYSLLLLFLIMLLLFSNFLNSLSGLLPAIFGGMLAFAVFGISGIDIPESTFVVIPVFTGFVSSYSIYMISLFRSAQNIEEVLKEASISLTQRSLATSMAFFCLMFSKSEMLLQIGLLGGVSVLGGALFCLIFLPHLIKYGNIPEKVVRKNFIERNVYYPFHAGGLLFVLVLLISIVLMIGMNFGIVEKESYFDPRWAIMMIIIPVGFTFFYGRIEMGIIASLPMFVGWLWVLGLMHFFSLSLSPANILVPVIIFGFGSDYSILLMRGLMREDKFGNNDFSIDKSFVLISFISTLSGLVTLLLIGTASVNAFVLISFSSLLVVMFICLFIQSTLYRFLTRSKTGKRRMAMTLWDIVFTFIAFSVFIGGCLLLNLLLPFILFSPVKRKAKKIFMHYLMMGFCRFETYLLFHVKKKIINIGRENFIKPALILSNHQSHIDLLLLLMLHPKMIVITNKWVWNNPVYSIVIRYLDFYSISDGYEKILEKLKIRIAEGYSILIFPEGSRSEDSKINRFHKGAFMVAEQLNLEIVPIIIHGAGDCMNKGENFLKRGSVTIKIFNRIKPSDQSYGNDYSERSKSILKFYRSEYAKMVEEYETPKYFGNQLSKNYFYKGPVLEWYSRIKIRQENYYSLFNDLVPRDATVVDMGCGYGFLSYMLSLVSDKRKVTGVDYDKNKIDAANNCASRNENISFVYSDVLTYNVTKSDVFILLDVLHYFSEEKQEKLIENCISNLNDNGLIIIRDAEKSLKKRHMGTLYTEIFSAFTGFNIRNSDKYFFTSKEKISGIISKHKLTLEIIDKSWFTSNLIYVIRKSE